METIKTRDPTSDLKKLVRQAQEYNQTAIDELYNRFRGMIINCINRSDVRKALKEDAENVAWEIFYNTVYGMDVERIQSVEGFLKASLYNGISQRLKKRSVATVSFDPQDEENQSIAVAEDVYETVLASYAFASYLRDLPEHERNLMKLLYVDGLTIAEASKRLGKGYKATAKMKYKCLRELKKYLTEES